MSRLSSALRALAVASRAQQPPLTQTALSTNTCSYTIGLGNRAPVSCAESCRSELSLIRSVSTSSPVNKENEKHTSPPDPATGVAPARPTFTARLRDLLAVSRWRISKGEVSRLEKVKHEHDLAEAAVTAAERGGSGAEAAVMAAERGGSGAEAERVGSGAEAAVLGKAASETLAAGIPADHTSAATAIGVDQALLQEQLLQGAEQQQHLQQQQQEAEERQPPPPQQRLLHPKYGYAALGGVVPSEEGTSNTAGLVGMLTSQHPRVNPRRRFMPGETYEAQDLNPLASRSPRSRHRAGEGVVRRPTAQEVMEKADYKNVDFLARWFLSPGGRLLPRKHTRLPVTVHKYVSRQIKLARHMGFMAGEARLDKLHLPRLRERELVEAQRRAAAAAEAGMGTEAGAAGRVGGLGYQRLSELGAL